MPRLAVGVVVHGCPDVSTPCMENLVRCRSDRPTSFFFLDNGSPEPDRLQVRAAMTRIYDQSRSVSLSFSDKNVGCAAGWNLVLQQALADPVCEAVVLAGHDTICHPEALLGLVRRYDRGGADLVSGVPFERDGELVPRDEEASGPDFSFLLIPRRVVDAVGLFDEKFWPAYFEDNDYHHRAKIAGCGVGIRTLLAPFRHYRSSSIRRYPDLNRHFAKNGAYYKRKWGCMPNEHGAALPFKGES